MIRQIAVTVATRLGLTALSLVTSIVTARYLGQTGRGDYFFIITLSATIVQVANVGLPASNTYLLAHDRTRLAGLLGNSLVVSVVLAGGIGAGVAILSHSSGLLQDTPVSYLWLAAALAPPSLFYMLASNLLVGLERIGTYNTVEVLSRIVVLVGMVGAALAGWGARGFVTTAVAAWIAAAAGTFLLLATRSSRVRPDLTVFRAASRYAAKAYAATLLGFLVLRANVFLLRREFGPAELGLYSVAAQMSDVLAILPQAVALVLFPKLVRGAADRWRRTVRAAAWTGLLLLVVCVATAVAAGPVVRLLYGDDFAPSARVLQWMLPGILCLGVANVFSQYLGAVGIPFSLIGLWLGAVALVAVLSLALIPDHAAAGAAVSLSIAYMTLLGAMMTLAYVHHRRHGDEQRDEPVFHDLESPTPVGE